MERKEFNIVLSCLFRKAKSLSHSNFIFVVGSVLRTGSAQRLSSQYFAAVPIRYIAELGPSGFFCPQPWFLWRSEHIFQGKQPPVIVDGSAINKQALSTIMNTVGRVVRALPSSRGRSSNL